MVSMIIYSWHFFFKISKQGYSAIVKTMIFWNTRWVLAVSNQLWWCSFWRTKDFKQRKIGFHGKNMGAFLSGSFYNNTWHFMMQIWNLMYKCIRCHDRPGIDSLVANMPLLLKKHTAKNNEEEITDIFRLLWVWSSKCISGSQCTIISWDNQFSYLYHLGFSFNSICFITMPLVDD